MTEVEALVLSIQQELDIGCSEHNKLGVLCKVDFSEFMKGRKLAERIVSCSAMPGSFHPSVIVGVATMGYPMYTIKSSYTNSDVLFYCARKAREAGYHSSTLIPQNSDDPSTLGYKIARIGALLAGSPDSPVAVGQV